MTETTKKATTATATKKATTTRRRTTAKKATATVEQEVVFENVKDIASHYFLTAKNVRRLLRQNFARSSEMKNAIYKFTEAESNAIKEFFDAKYKTKTEDK